MSTIECVCHWCGASLVRRSAPSIKSRLHFCDNSCKGEWQKTAKPVSKEWLYEHYVTKGLDTTQIGHIVQRDPKSVWNWLKDFDIPRRPRGSNTSVLFQKGHKLGVGRKASPETRKRMSDHAKATGRVPYDPAVGSYMKGRKGAETPNWKGGISPERQAFYGTDAWKMAARIVRHRDKKTCQRCGLAKGCPEAKGISFDIHHIVGFECVNLRADPTNLVYLCEPCHYWVHGNDNTKKEFIGNADSANG